MNLNTQREREGGGGGGGWRERLCSVCVCFAAVTSMPHTVFFSYSSLEILLLFHYFVPIFVLYFLPVSGTPRMSGPGT